jgi:hypothetical protein
MSTFVESHVLMINRINTSQLAQEYYDNLLIPIMSRQLVQAEAARQDANHSTVRRLFLNWTEPAPQNETILTALRDMHRRVGDLPPQHYLVRTGFAGLARVLYVDTNSALKVADNLPSREVRRRISDAEQVYVAVDLNTIPALSLEVAQDRANNALIEGNKQRADRILNSGILNAKNHIDNLAPHVYHALYVPDISLKEFDYELFKKKKSYIATLSALGVLTVRKARAEKKLPDLIQGLNYYQQSHVYEPNLHRFATLSWWTMLASIDPRYQGDLSSRYHAFRTSLSNLREVHKNDKDKNIIFKVITEPIKNKLAGIKNKIQKIAKRSSPPYEGGD